MQFAAHMLFFLTFFLCSSLYSLRDLEKKVQNFVLETKQIYLPEYPYAFNPSIIRWDGCLLMSFRVLPDARCSFTSQIGLVWLDENFSPISAPQILVTQIQDSSIVPSRAEDARLVAIGKKLYMVYDDNQDVLITKGGYRVYIAEIKFDGENFSVNNNQCLNQFEGESWLKREKSWVPFDYQGKMMLAYSLCPHLIFAPSMQDGVCETVCSTNNSIKWKWGDLRGGTPAIKEGNEYLSFFHSSIDMPSQQSGGVVLTHYFMGAYTFASEPPFNITQVSPKPIVAKGFYSGKKYQPYWKPVQVVFPCGIISDKKYIWIAYGKQDHEIWIAKLDKKALLKSLVKVE